MRILVTGHDGYIGAVMVPLLEQAGHEVVGLDTGFFEDCGFPSYRGSSIEASKMDVRDAQVGMLSGFHAVVHLAALSNDPLGDLDADLTYAINYRASVRLAEMARAAGIERFVFASSCSLYGVQGEGMLDETAPFNPLTPYGESKILAEREISALATDDFSPTFMRNATVYGASPRLRTDVVVNNLVGHAVTTGEVLILSDGTPWRPLVHVQDASNACRAVLESSREVIHNQAFNVGRTQENYQVREVAELVEANVPGSRVRYADEGGPDPRNYRVSCEKLETSLPDYQPTWTVEKGVKEVRDALEENRVLGPDFQGPRYFRIRRIRSLLEDGRLSAELRWNQNSAREGG